MTTVIWITRDGLRCLEHYDDVPIKRSDILNWYTRIRPCVLQVKMNLTPEPLPVGIEPNETRRYRMVAKVVDDKGRFMTRIVMQET